MKSRFVVATLGPVPDLDDETAWRSTCDKISRGMPWLLEDSHEVLYVGAGRGWRGEKKREGLTSQSLVGLTPWFAVNALMTWSIQFVKGTVWAIRHESVVVLVPDPSQGLGFTLVKVFFRRLRLVVRIQGFRASENLLVKKSRWRYWLSSALHGYAVRHADLVLPVSKWLSSLALTHGATAERMLVMPNRIPWAGMSEVTDLPQVPTVLFAGRLEKEKAVESLLEAMVFVRKHVPNAIALIAGNGSEREALEHRAESLGLCTTVSFLGWLKPHDMIKAYERATVLLLPTISEEGLGMVLVEAGLMGRPVICSGTGGMCDVISDGKNGLVLPCGDTDNLGRAIVKILSDVPLARRMGLAGREMAEQFLIDTEESVRCVRQAVLKLALQ